MFNRLLTCLIAAAGALAAPAVLAETLLAGPDGSPMSFAQALAQAKDGDTIELLPGTYTGQVGVIERQRLRIVGMEPRPVFEAAGRSAQGKAAWVVRGGDITIENVGFRGNRVPDGNGAGIRLESGRLWVKGCEFTDNEAGILTGNDGLAELRIEDSVFSQAPHAVGRLPHLLYVGRIARVEISGSRFHAGFEGHLIKSRAAVSRIAYNLIYDGEAGGASYEIDLPNGGDAVLIGNIIGQGRHTQNPVMVAYGAEGRPHAKNRLLMSHNTLISDYTFAWFLRSWPERLGNDVQIRAVNNLTVGAGLFGWGSAGDFSGNWPTTAGSLADPAALGFELNLNSWLRGRADPPGELAGPEAVPQAEFTLPIGTRPLTPPSAWSPGALQR
jgi:hypothetical protein